MISKINSAVTYGMQIEKVSIEVAVTNGLPDLRMVGLPDAVVRESKERVRLAIRNSGFEYPRKKIVVNLAPANLKKEGACFDLPIAIGILMASNQIHSVDVSKYIFLGELSLNGEIRKVHGVLPVVLHFCEDKDWEFIVPEANTKEIALAGIRSPIIKNIKQLVSYLEGNDCDVSYQSVNVAGLICGKDKKAIDLKDIKGQKMAKRALEIAVAGGHNILLKGPPGTGKTMLAKAIQGILPDLDRETCLEVSKIYSIAGELTEESPIISAHPFRSPHHSTARPAMIGGGNIPKPGEVSLAHMGVLYLDEITEFSKNVLESLREPLEDGEVTISRVAGKFRYPASFMLVASMNPCPCGYLGSSKRECTCSLYEIRQYTNKLSGPLLDRIDMIITTDDMDYDMLHSPKEEDSSKVIKSRVEKARFIQKERFAGRSFTVNAGMSGKDIRRFCEVCPESKHLLRQAFYALGLSARSYNKVLKMSRTIADMNGHPQIMLSDLSEALHYRS